MIELLGQNPLQLKRQGLCQTDTTTCSGQHINKRLEFTDMSDTPCAFSEAPAEGIFSIYSRVSQDRASATTQHLTGLTRVAAHGPPVATEAAASLAADAMKNFKSKFGERFCTRSWGRGKTSTTTDTLKAKKWDW